MDAGWGPKRAPPPPAPSLPPSSRQQLRQLFTDPSYASLRELFCSYVLTKLRFKQMPELGARLRRRVEELVAAGCDDTQAYEALRAYVHGELFISPEYARMNRDVFSRERNRIEQLEPLLAGFLATPADGQNPGAGSSGRREVASYLDVGCNEGSITDAVGAHLGARAVHGCDVQAPTTPAAQRQFAFTLLDQRDPYRLPYADRSQDVVTAFMSLHHIEQVHRTLGEIHRVLRDDGLLVVREHDCTPPELALLLDLMHGFYAMVWADPPEMPDFVTHYSCYRSRAELLELLQRPRQDGGRDAGPLFRCVQTTEPLGAWRHYYAVFVKGDTYARRRDLVLRWFPHCDGAVFRADRDDNWRAPADDRRIRSAWDRGPPPRTDGYDSRGHRNRWQDRWDRPERDPRERRDNSHTRDYRDSRNDRDYREQRDYGRDYGRDQWDRRYEYGHYPLSSWQTQDHGAYGPPPPPTIAGNWRNPYGPREVDLRTFLPNREPWPDPRYRQY